MSEASKPQHPTANPRRSGFRWSVAAGLTLLVVSALFLSNTRTTSHVAGEGLGLARAEAALGANDLALKALAQAVLLAEDNALGIADGPTLELAVVEAEATVSELTSRVDDLIAAVGADVEAAQLAPAVAGEAGSVIELIESGEIDAAGRRLTGPAVASFEKLRDSLNHLRANHELALSETRATANRLGDLVTFLVVFLIPVGAILAYHYAARRQLRAAEAHLDTRLEAEREVVRAKDEFIGNISHELRTPLTAIFGFSELLLESGIVDPRGALDLIGHINHQSGELSRMVEDLLVSARLEANALAYKIQEVDVRREVSSVLNAMQQGGSAIDVLIIDNTCWGDPVRIRQILRNLLSNAHRYGGASVRVTAEERDGMLEISVADTGLGVPKGMEPRLFTRYVHEGREALTLGSVGLGLSVVGSMAEGMSGSAHYEHHDGWARFAVRLPLTDPELPGSSDPADSYEGAIAVNTTHLAALTTPGNNVSLQATPDGDG